MFLYYACNNIKVTHKTNNYGTDQIIQRAHS